MKRVILHAILPLAALLLATRPDARADGAQPPDAAAPGPSYEPKRVTTTRISGPRIDAQTAVLLDEQPSAILFHAGTVVWHGDTPAPPDLPAIRGEVLIPGRLTMTLLLRRNTDLQVNATHTIEIALNPQAQAAHGQVVGLNGLFMTLAQGARGNPLIGSHVTTADNHFLYRLSTFPGDMQRNIALLRNAWLYVPIIYEDGHHAALSLAKGTAGARIFNDAIAAWEKDDAEANGMKAQ
jgi:hypothetical protein